MVNYRDLLVVLVHGLGGAPEETWGKFPELIAATFPEKQVRVVSYSFPSTITGLFKAGGWKERLLSIFGKGAPIQDLALGLKTDIENRHPSSQNIILVCHSLGGLIAKQYIIYCKKEQIPHKIIGCLFYAVPHSGATLASVAKHLLVKNSHLAQLARNSDFIETLSYDWRTLKLDSEIDAKYIVSGADQVVSRLSSMGGEWGSTSIQYVPGSNHRSIVKPSSPDDLSFLICRRYISEKLETLGDYGAIGKRKTLALFDSYTPECEPFYVARECDAHLESVLEFQGAWVWGISGVGKTAAIRRMIFRSERQTYFLGLANHAGAGVWELITSVANELGHLTGCEAIPPEADQSEIIKQLSKSFGQLKGDWVIAIEEIPLRTHEDFAAFLENLAGALIHAAQHNSEHCGVKLIFSSIYNPLSAEWQSRAKILEKIRPIHFQPWRPDDILTLIAKIQSGIDVEFEQDLVSAISDRCGGNPRAVKHILREYLSTYSPKKSIDHLVSQCCDEVLS